MPVVRRAIASSFVGMLLLCLGACGDGERVSVADTADDEDGSGRAQPCELLSAEQIATVLPGADAGYVAARGGSLIEGIDSYQCSYSDPEMNMLLVMFHTAATDALFDEIKPKDPTWIVGEANVQPVQIGDGGWVYTSDDLKLTASRGRLVIELALDSPNEAEQGTALTNLGSALLDALTSAALSSI